ncbi:alanine--tRNA ligase [Candidatus Daviesbacteria bacterium]|nr:alanine--tRNA ligase [Candidatus Daviesbacteria bacterium]
MTSKDIRDKYIKFFVDKGHKEIAPAKLVPENDSSTLFTSSGMQPLVAYLLGENHPAGKRLVDSQPSFRAEDIEEVGDNRHTTFFEMLGNWSLGDYFKKDQLPWFWEFLTQELGLPKEQLYVSIFEGNDSVPKDMESYEIWKSLGVAEDHIYAYGVEKNWWSRSGPPSKMPAGEIGGPDSEVFYKFTQIGHDLQYGDKCHPNCNCGKFLEIGNSVFIQYQKQADGSLKELPNKNVDFGGGLERLTAVILNEPDIFRIDLFSEIISTVEEHTGKRYTEVQSQSPMQVIADHIKAAVFLIINDVRPSNKLQGYILRRLLRRSALKIHQLGGGLTPLPGIRAIAESVLIIYDGLLGIDRGRQRGIVGEVVTNEINKFGDSLDRGLKHVEKIKTIDGKITFDLYQTFGFPYEVTEELFRQKGQQINKEQFKTEFEKHRELSRTASSGMFKGGLADHSEIVTKYHTATHLLHQALRDVLGPQVFQKGSNITSERLRFDFSYDQKMTDEEIKKTEDIINQRIKEDLKVDKKIVAPEAAKKMNAIGLFDEKYGTEVSIYGVGPNYVLDSQAKDQRERAGYYSLEFCGGPHVEHTGVIGKINRGTILQGKIKITKEEAISAGIRRIRAQIVLK